MMVFICLVLWIGQWFLLSRFTSLQQLWFLFILSDADYHDFFRLVFLRKHLNKTSDFDFNIMKNAFA